MLRHKNGKTVRHGGKSPEWLHLRDTCTILGLSTKPNVKNKPTKKIKTADVTGRCQQALYMHKTTLESFLVRSKRTEKVAWLREEVFGIKPPRNPEVEEKLQTPRDPATATADPYDQILELQLCLADLYDNFALSRDFKARIRELLPGIPKPTPRKKAPFRLDAVEIEENVLMFWLLRRADGRVFVELGLVLELLGSDEPLEAYADDETFLTVRYECCRILCFDPYKDKEETLDFIEVKHLQTLEGHAGKTNSKLQAAIDKILRSVPREE